MIPAQAVEAAAKRLAGARHGLWELTPEPKRRLFLRDARLALEAAAPHMVERQWGVRDRHSLIIAGHPSEESARGTAAVRPEWYEVVSRPMPGLWMTP